MHSSWMNCRMKRDSTISAVGPRFGSTKLAAAAVCGTLTLTLLSALLLFAARPAQAQTETVLYNFTGGADGLYPTSSLVSDGAGNFYGTTVLGGTCPGWNQYGCGVVFEISPNGSGGWKQMVLHTFSAPPDGANPFCAPLIFDSAGNLYGTTEFGGAYNWGSVFELSPVGGSWTVNILHSFSYGANGDHPSTGLIMDKAGNLYGTNSEYESPGSVFELSPSGSGWTYQVIYVAPVGQGVTMDAAGNIYGVTASTVFELSPNGNGSWNSTVLHTFTGAPDDGINPYIAPVFDQAGNLYGTTSSGGAKNYGTVYRLSPPTKKWQKGEWKETILHSFRSGHDGADPIAGVVLDAAGNIYGTTGGGGKFSKGTVFELSRPVGKGWYKEKVLLAFNGTDGNYPEAGLMLDSAGNLYGTASNGGSSAAGVVFELTP